MYNSQLIQEITTLKSWDQKVDHFLNMSPLLREGAEHYKAFGISVMSRLEAISDFEWNYKKSIKSHTILLRADGVHLNIDKDYGLSKVSVLYQEQGTPHFIVRYRMFIGCCYCGCCLQFLHYTSANVATVVVVLQYFENMSSDQFWFQLLHHNFTWLTKSLYMFRAPTCPSSGGLTIYTPQLVQCHLKLCI